MPRTPGGELSDWSLESETAERLRVLLRRRRAGRMWPGEHSPSRLVLLAIGVGIVAGVAAWLFRGLIGFVHNLLFLGEWSTSYDASLQTPPSPWGAGIILVPVLGAMLVALLVKRFAPEAKGHGVPEVVDAIYFCGGVIRPVVALVKALASSISIGSGGSVGLLLLCLLKLLATALTLGSGGSGGIFSPSLFMGATFAAGCALLLNSAVPGIHLDIASAAVIGMAALVGASTGAVITAIVMIFEMTRDYNVIVPLMATVSVAYGARRLLLTDSIYTLKLKRRGHVIPDAFHTNLYLVRTVVDFIRTPMQRCDAQRPVASLLDEVQRQRYLPHILVTRDGDVHGVLSARRLLHMLRRGERAGSVGDHAQTSFAVVQAQDVLFDVVAHLRDAATDIALLTKDGRLRTSSDVVGIVTWTDMLLHGNLPLPLRRRHRPPAPAAKPDQT